MAQTLTLTTAQKASLAVAHDDGAGTVTPLGANFNYNWQSSAGSSSAIAAVTNGAGGLFIEGTAEGTDTLHITASGLTADVEVTVTDEDEEEPSGPHLVVTLGTPEPK